MILRQYTASYNNQVPTGLNPCLHLESVLGPDFTTTGDDARDTGC
jgi:hypothetical protein